MPRKKATQPKDTENDLREVRTVSKNDQTTTIEWIDEAGSPKRGVIPTGEVQEAGADSVLVSVDVFEAATPYGLDWESLLLELIPEDIAATVAKSLRVRNLYTLDDLNRRPAEVIAAVQGALNLTVGNIRKKANEKLRRK